MERRILLIDATGLVFRAFYSIKTEMSAPDGTPVNAVFGLTRMILRIYREVPATASAIVFDAGRETFRTELYPEYKAQRPAPPNELRQQFGLAIDASRATMAPVFVEVGYEADDVIATLAAQAQAADYHVSILTSDRDILQLLSRRCEIFMPAKRGNLVRYDIDAFEGQYGFPVERFVDFKALMGDPSDNIPGVRGIGAKGAARLVSTYGRLEQVYGNLDHVSPSGVQRKLRNARDEVFLYRDLITLKQDVPVAYDFTNRTLPDFANAELQELLVRLGFSRVRRDALELGDLMTDAY